MRRQVLAAVRMVLVLTVALGIVYPLTITAVAQLTMAHRADGSLVSDDGRIVGSALIGQSFPAEGWFRGRPDAYDPRASGASNLGPTNPELGALVRERLAELRVTGFDLQAVPVEALTTSASGLDPHVSPAYARAQAPAVARARDLALEDVLALIEAHVEPPDLGVLGQERVNVLALNIALLDLASRS